MILLKRTRGYKEQWHAVQRTHSPKLTDSHSHPHGAAPQEGATTPVLDGQVTPSATLAVCCHTAQHALTPAPLHAAGFPHGQEPLRGTEW